MRFKDSPDSRVATQLKKMNLYAGTSFLTWEIITGTSCMPLSLFRVHSLIQAKLQEEVKAATPGILARFEKLLKGNNDGKGFFVGDKVRRHTF